MYPRFFAMHSLSARQTQKSKPIATVQAVNVLGPECFRKFSETGTMVGLRSLHGLSRVFAGIPVVLFLAENMHFILCQNAK